MERSNLVAKKKTSKVQELSIYVRSVDNGYTVHSNATYGGQDWKSSEAHNKQLIYTDKEEAIKSAASLINAFSKDLL